LVPSGADGDLEDGQTRFELAGLEQLRRSHRRTDERPRANDRVVESERVDCGDLEDPPDRLDRVEPGEVVGARDRLLPPPAESTEAPGIGRLVLALGAVPQAIAF
jgi:hypothetical protein